MRLWVGPSLNMALPYVWSTGASVCTAPVAAVPGSRSAMVRDFATYRCCSLLFGSRGL